MLTAAGLSATHQCHRTTLSFDLLKLNPFALYYPSLSVPGDARCPQGIPRGGTRAQPFDCVAIRLTFLSSLWRRSQTNVPNSSKSMCSGVSGAQGPYQIASAPEARIVDNRCYETSAWIKSYARKFVLWRPLSCGQLSPHMYIFSWLCKQYN